jgi:hypothetical protein
MTTRKTNERIGVSPEQAMLFENARAAVSVLKRSFEAWLTIGRAVVEARAIANDRGGRNTFMLLIEQQGLSDIVNKSTATRLERIMDPENLPRVVEWHASLTLTEQIAWCAPTTVFKHCPHLRGLKPAPKKPTSNSSMMLERIKGELRVANAEVERLTAHTAELEAARDRNISTPVEAGDSIITALRALFAVMGNEDHDELANKQATALRDAGFSATEIRDLTKWLKRLASVMWAMAMEDDRASASKPKRKRKATKPTEAEQDNKALAEAAAGLGRMFTSLRKDDGDAS